MGNARNVAFWVVLFLLILALFNLFSGDSSSLQSRESSYSDFVASVEAGQVQNVVIDGEKLRYQTQDGSSSTTILPADAEVTKLLTDKGINVRAESQETSGLQAFLVSLLPFLLLIGVWI
ncbi:MAG: ATP-dependent metallopeptidase FtsH/Yme1/Tma family protein, partial [Pseudomonadota bacterium]|nr:ATP-dependent metallopeptidase FtsH/Yme1/Tma family protein [Pseudomonadota bacterium]